MKKCRECGARNPDGVTKCQSCNSTDLMFVQPNNNQNNNPNMNSNMYPNMNPNMYPQMGGYQAMPYGSTFSTYKSSEYNSLGGFLLFLVVANWISAVSSMLYGLVFCVQLNKIASLLGGWGVGGGAFRGLGFLVLVITIVLGILQIRLCLKIQYKNEDFLKYYQILNIVYTVIMLILIVLSKRNYDYYEGGNSTLVYGITMIIMFVVGNIYFCTSERVYYYMGNNAYIRQSIFTSGVSRWNMLEQTRRMTEGPSSLEKIRAGMSDLQTNYAYRQPGMQQPVNQQPPVQQPVNQQPPVQQPVNQQPAMQTTQPASAQNTQTQNSPDQLSLEDMEALKKLKELKDLGVMSEEEYEKYRNKYIPEDNNEEASEIDSTEAQDTASGEETDQVDKASEEDTFEWKCNGCNTINSPDRKICKYCGGVKMMVGYTIVTGKMPLFCEICGAKLNPNSRFCVECGTEVQRVEEN